MRPQRRQVVGGLVILLTICLYTWAVHNMYRLEEEMQYVSFVNTMEGGIPVTETQEEDQILWSKYTDRQVENKALFRNTDTSVFALHGRSDLLFRGAPMLNEQSETSCLISTALAYELFGGTDVTGLLVTYRGKDYEIAGVIDQEEKLLVYEPEKEEVVTFGRLMTKVEQGESVRVLEERLRMKYGSGNVLDYTLLKALLDLYLLVIPVLLSIVLLRMIWKYQKESQRKPEKCIWIVIFGIAGIIFGFLIIRNIHLPLDMIPSKWSDFDFWSDYAKGQQENFVRLIRLEKTEFDMRFMRAIKNILCYNTMAIFFTVLGIKKIKAKKELAECIQEI